jgi:2-methylisocitrate lyase-like PEP mutase family enzyme
MPHHPRVDTFRSLHEAGCFVMPNPWDVGSARLLEQLGFPALASTSSGLAWSLGRPDGRVSLKTTLEHFRTLAAAVQVPVNGDFLGGFAVEPKNVAANVRLAATTGIAGLSIEDSTGVPDTPLYDIELAVARVAAARAAIDGGPVPVLLTARTEGFIVGVPDLDEAIRRLVRYKEAGADCLYAPGLTSLEQVRAVVEAVAPTPVNVLVGRPFATVSELADAGVRRISVGGALARTAWGALLRAAREMAETGTFTSFDDAVPFAELDGRFS